MKTYRTLHAAGLKEVPVRLFETVMSRIESILASNIRDSRLTEADRFAQSYLERELRRKEKSRLGGGLTDKQRTDATLAGWLERESVNRQINESFHAPEDLGNGWYYYADTGPFQCTTWDTLFRARAIIRDIMGRVDYARIERGCKFGNGASCSLPRKDAGAPLKYMNGRTVTPSLRRTAERLILSSPAWRDAYGVGSSDTWLVAKSGVVLTYTTPPMSSVLGGVMDFVDKTAKVKRVIVKEPEINGYLQKGIGKELRRLLRVFVHGINLNTSGTRNSRLARIGSRGGKVATVDAERASDSIVLAVCGFFFSEEWMNLLLHARSPYVQLPSGKWHRLSMMAGMGNGFCFELESILFYAIGLACAEKSTLAWRFAATSIHGDDLTVPSDVMHLVQAAYEKLGIVVNGEKSFSEGPFRESCGGHYYEGLSVKPFYKRESTGLVRGDWFWLCNSLTVWLADRSPTYRVSYGGRELLQCISYLRWYSSSGDVQRWLTPFSNGLRSGLFGEAPNSTGAWYTTRNIVSVQDTEEYPDIGRYAAWLQTPTVSPSVMEVLFPTHDDSGQYEKLVDTRERERTVRLAHWELPLSLRALVRITAEP